MTIGTTNGLGYYTPGMTVLSGAVLSSASKIPVDTGLTGGALQTGAIIPGTQCAPAAQIGLTANVAKTKAAGTQLGYGVNTVSVCATATNSCLMPYAFPGAFVTISNDGATSTTVFGKGTDTIDGVATATGNPLAAAARCLYYGSAGSGDGSDAGAWISNKTAKSS